MKVINSGKERSYRIYCPNCDSDLEYTKDDVRVLSNGDNVVECCVCGMYLGIKLK